MKSFLWDKIYNYQDLSILCIARASGSGFRLQFYLNNEATPVHLNNYQVDNALVVPSFTSIDGLLVVSSGKEILCFSYNGASVSLSQSVTLKIRDMFGVSATYEGKDLWDPKYQNYRPRTVSHEHIYNIRNQTFGPIRRKRTKSSPKDLRDPLFSFTAEWGVYPSNCDNVLYGLHPDVTSESNPTMELFWPEELRPNISSTMSPRGFFIIDALDRGTSRMEAIRRLYSSSSRYGGPKSLSLPQDTTIGGATCITQFSGRVFYAGFGEKVVGGDRNSPNLSSYILFSKLVSSPRDLGICYQDGDPTSEDKSDLLDTDGGFLRIDGVNGISFLGVIGQSLVCIAKNGVWAIQGEDRGQFKATSLSRIKVSDVGCGIPESICSTGDAIMFFGDDGIYMVAQDKMGDLVCENVTIGKCSSLISDRTFTNLSCCYDKISKKVHWAFSVDGSPCWEEIIYWTRWNAFTSDLISKPTIDSPYDLSAICYYPSRRLELTLSEVTDSFDVPVTTEGLSPVYVETFTLSESSDTNVIYIINDGEDEFFCTKTSSTFYDFETGSYSSYLLTGWTLGTSPALIKQAPYLIAYLGRTETTFEEVDGEWVNITPSSCLISSQWDWANLSSSNKWGVPRQAYRYRRQWSPDSVETDSQEFNGFPVIVSRNKLRGSGKALSLKMESEGSKDMHIIGLSMLIGSGDGI